jgi:hypothetical protein
VALTQKLLRKTRLYSIQSALPPFQGLKNFVGRKPRALPWAIFFCPCRASVEVAAGISYRISNWLGGLAPLRLGVKNHSRQFVKFASTNLAGRILHFAGAFCI